MKKAEIFICECSSTEHQMVFYFYDATYNGELYPIVYIHVNLNQRSFWERLVHGIKYIFGYKSRFGAFEEFVINPDDADRLQEVVNYLKTGQK